LTQLEFNEDDILTKCALRFDGYAYHIFRNRDLRARWEFPDLVDRIEKTREFPEDDLESLAAFFALQRFLGKWGGEYLTPHSNEHVVFRLLFLHVYRLEIPEEFRHREFYRVWENEFRPYREEFAARIRKTFRRRGRGPKIFVG
jgi:hypothetical protein